MLYPNTQLLPTSFQIDRFQYIYSTSPYFLNLQELWTNWPQREIDGLTKTYILVQWAVWSQQVFVIHMEERRKDYWQILTHHFVTIALIAASYAYHHTRVGTVILVSMDIIELIFPVSQVETCDP